MSLVNFKINHNTTTILKTRKPNLYLKLKDNIPINFRRDGLKIPQIDTQLLCGANNIRFNSVQDLTLTISSMQQAIDAQE